MFCPQNDSTRKSGVPLVGINWFGNAAPSRSAKVSPLNRDRDVEIVSERPTRFVCREQNQIRLVARIASLVRDHHDGADPDHFVPGHDAGNDAVSESGDPPPQVGALPRSSEITTGFAVSL
jgi:hypothetical protein